MNHNEFFKIIGIIIFCFFIIYLIIKMFKLQKNMVEGLISGDTNTINTTDAISGEGGTSASYGATIKAQVIKLQDKLLISKYRKDYEQIIVNLDDYLGYLMIEQTLNMKMNDVKTNIENLNALNILKNAKDSLNTTMAFLDKQQ
jgi:hypothetical protein